MKRINPKAILWNILQGFLVVFATLFVTLCLRIFLFASFVIPSPSMSPALETGDYIFVSKLIPGPRVYKNFAFLEGAKVETYRFRGVRPVRRNDVLVFNFPYSDGSKITLAQGEFGSGGKCDAGGLGSSSCSISQGYPGGLESSKSVECSSGYYACCTKSIWGNISAFCVRI